MMPRKRIVKRQPPRGANKRRRGLEDDLGRTDDEAESEAEGPHEPEEREAPQTPKRARIAPEAIPLGLARTDYHDLHLREQESQQGLGISARIEQGGKTNGDEWTAEDDRILVELVLEKLKLTKSDWQDCARSLGRDRHSVGRRWKSLMAGGDVGLKTRSSRRAKLHSTWR